MMDIDLFTEMTHNGEWLLLLHMHKVNACCRGARMALLAEILGYLLERQLLGKAIFVGELVGVMAGSAVATMLLLRMARY